ncbi:MAG TPA: aldo/keto reductase [Bacillales bacterium]|nr:aldo/keto reductase [Bacillales bacterium]
MIEGFATLQDSQDYFSDKQAIKRSTPWFSVSPIALGTHLGEMTEANSQLYRESMEHALNNGINFIDTAINYRGMKSERDVGKTLKKLIEKEQSLKREEVVISTKAGIIPGDIDAGLVPKDYLQKRLLEGGVIRKSDLNIVEHQRHTLAPSYYSFAVGESRKHLNLETIDIHYIHNPELSMMVLGPEDFYQQLQQLFVLYEKLVKHGHIRFYGIATWDAFLNDPEESGYISLDKAFRIAESIAGKDHHFRFVQMPYNLVKNEANQKASQPVSGKMLTPINAAAELGLYVTVSAPLAQGKHFNKKSCARDFLNHAVNTKGVLSAMVGTKHVEHVRENLSFLQNGLFERMDPKTR